MIKRLPVRRLILILLPILFAGVISFFQAIQIPLEQTPAEKVLDAWNIIHGNMPLTGWKFHPLELPVYLLSVVIFRLSTFAAITASECFYLILFISGLLILSAYHMLTPVSCLIWFTLAGTPDQSLIRNIQKEPMFYLSLLYFLHFLSKLTDLRVNGAAEGYGSSEEEKNQDPGQQHHRTVKDLTGLVISLTALLPAINLPVSFRYDPAGMHQTLRILQKVFRGDFSKQPLFQLATIRYFLNTVILLMIFFVVCNTIFTAVRKHRMLLPQIPYSAGLILTIILCSYVRGLPEKELLCSWILFGGGILLSTAYESSSLKKSRFMGYRLPFSAAAAVFFLAAICFRIEPAVTSRPQGTADKITAFLQEHELLQGYCAPEDHAVLTTASKGKIRFTDNADDPDNAFSVLPKETMPEKNDGEIYEIDPYMIIIEP